MIETSLFTIVIKKVFKLLVIVIREVGRFYTDFTFAIIINIIATKDY